MKKKILVPLVGIHSAGKSTIRKELDKLGYINEEECAEILRKNENLAAGANADISFEYLVRKAEAERDKTRVWNTDMILVESWHLLTLAYMLTRGEKIESLDEYLGYVREQSKIHDIHCVFLKSNPLKILDRSRKLHSEEDIDQYYEFYQKLGENILYILKVTGLDYREFDTMKPLEETLEEVKQYLREIQKPEI